MQEFQLGGHPDVAISVRRSRRARRMSLRVSSLDGRVTLTLPNGTPERVARAFAEEKARWIKKAMGQVAVPVPVCLGAELPIEGVMHPLVPGARRAAEIFDGAVKAPAGHEARAAEVLLKHLARDRLTAAVARFAAEIERPFGKITLRDTRSRWGSCSAAGNLMFSWRLIMAPPPVLRYVAAHEVAHLEFMDHSANFWSLCKDLCPDFKTQRAWLRTHGTGLHRYQFRTTD